MMIRFFDFSKFHGKYPPTGSTNIRVHQLIKYWEEADVYKFGENPDVLIFQKVYMAPDYKFPAHFKNKKILDLCDADWLGGLTPIKETVDAVDAVTCSSDTLTEFIKQLTDKPVITVADRFDLATIPEPKQHKGRAKKAVWFGYRHNAQTIRYAMPTIKNLDLDLIIVSDDDPMAWQWLPPDQAQDFKQNHYQYIRYDDATVYDELQKADICVLPTGTRPVDKFKSNNKTTKAILAGLPVAKDGDQLRSFIIADNRQAYIDKHYQKTREEYSVVKSIEEYKELIERI